MIKKNIKFETQEGVTLLKFGTGDIGVAEVMIKDKSAIAAIGFWDQESKPMDRDYTDLSGKPIDEQPNLVLMTFDRLESIDNIIHFLKKCKDTIISSRLSKPESFDEKEKKFLSSKEQSEEIPKGTFDGAGSETLEIHYNFSSVKRAKYIPADSILEVEFSAGTTYHYKNVPPEKWEEMKKCEKAGSFVHKELKQYEYAKIN